MEKYTFKSQTHLLDLLWKVILELLCQSLKVTAQYSFEQKQQKCY